MGRNEKQWAIINKLDSKIERERLNFCTICWTRFLVWSHRMRVCSLIKVCFYTNFKIWKLVPVFPPFSEIIRCTARWTVRAALSTLHLSALLRTSRSLCKCCHKNCPTDCDEHEGVISRAVAFKEKSKIFNCTQEWDGWEKTCLLSLIKTMWIFIPLDFRHSYLHSTRTDTHLICSRLPRVFISLTLLCIPSVNKALILFLSLLLVLLF